MSLFTKSVRDAKRRNAEVAKAASRQVGTYAGNSSALNPFAQRDQLTQHEEQLNHNKGYVNSVVRTIARTIAGQSIHVGRVTDDIEEISQASFRVKSLKMPSSIKDVVTRKSAQHFSESVEVLTEHPFLNALQNPNPMMGKFQLIENAFTCLEFCGIMYWWFQFPTKQNKLTNARIYPLPPSWVTPLHSESKLFAAFQIRPTGFSAPFVVPGNEIGMFYYSDPANPMLPFSTMQSQSGAVKIDEQIEECQLRHFTNGHKPGLAIIVGKIPGTEGVSGPDQPILTVEQRAQLVSAVNRNFQGSINHNNPLILDGFIKDAKKITESVSEMDYPDSAKSSRRRVGEGWGVSTLITGEMQTANRAGSTVAKEHFYDFVINPRIAMFSEALTHTIAPMFPESEQNSEKIVCWIENMIAVDQEFDLALDIAMVDRAAKSVNEWRQKHNLPPREGGDEYTVRTTATAKPTDPNADDSDDEDDPKKKPKQKSWHEQLGLAGHIKVMHGRAVKMESELKYAVKTFLIQMGEKVGAILRHHLRGNTLIEPGLADLVIQDSEWKDELLFVMKPILLKSAISSATIEWNMHQTKHSKGFFADLVALPKLLVETIAFKIGEWLDGLETPKIFDSIRTATKKAIQAVKEKFRGAEAVDKIVSLVFGDTASSERAGVIASVENCTAINVGNDATLMHLGTLGLINAKRWCSQEDGHVRQTHVKANGQIVGLHEQFKVGLEFCTYPGDPSLSFEERIHCRCFEVGVTR